MRDTTPLTCRIGRRLIYESAATEGNGTDRASLEAHTSVCRECAAEWQALRTVTDWTRNYPVPEPDDRYWQYLAGTIMTRARRERRRRAFRGGWLPPLPRLAAVVGCAVLLFATGLALGQHRVSHFRSAEASASAAPSPSLAKEKIVPVSVPVPVVVVQTERIVETKIVTRWREKPIPLPTSSLQAKQEPKVEGQTPRAKEGKTVARGKLGHSEKRKSSPLEMEESSSDSPFPHAPVARQPAHQTPAAPLATPGDEPPPPQVERNEFREYVLRSLPEPPLMPVAGRALHRNADTVVAEPEATLHDEPVGSFVTPVRMVEVRSWPMR